MSAGTDTWAVVLAGGIGSRFWPASTPSRPKQLLPLGGERPLVAEAVARARTIVGAERVRVLAGDDLAAPLREVLPELGEEHFLLEPEPKGTGPVLAWAARYVEDASPGACMLSLHADHVIAPEDGFRRTARAALAAARARGALVCIGIVPDRPETGYGYLEVGEEIGGGAFRVDRFREKPDAATARSFHGSGRHLWNSGIFAWRAADFLTQVRRHCPEIAGALPRLERGDVAGYFAQVSPVTVDVGVLERADAVEVVPAGFRWDDLGTWAALARTQPADACGNVLLGETRLVDAEDNIVWAEEGRVTLFGVSGLVVVRAGKETLVTTREAAGQLKRLLGEGGEATP